MMTPGQFAIFVSVVALISGVVVSAIVYLIFMSGIVELESTTTNSASYDSHPWCGEAENLKPDDFCIQSMTYKEFELSAYDPMRNFKLYGVKVGEESRAAVANGETRILGGKEVPICRVVYKYKDANFCYNDETMDANLVGRDAHGKVVIIAAKDYHDVTKGFVAEIKDGVN